MQSDNMTDKWRIYMTKDGRISLAGLSLAKCDYLADAIPGLLTTMSSNASKQPILVVERMCRASGFLLGAAEMKRQLFGIVSAYTSGYRLRGGFLQMDGSEILLALGRRPFGPLTSLCSR